MHNGRMQSLGCRLRRSLQLLSMFDPPILRIFIAEITPETRYKGEELLIEKASKQAKDKRS